MPDAMHLDKMTFSKGTIARDPHTWLPEGLLDDGKYGVDLSAGRKYDELPPELQIPEPAPLSTTQPVQLEVMWMALLRSISFTAHDTDVMMREAKAELSTFGIDDPFRPAEWTTWNNDYVSRLLKEPIPDGDPELEIARHVTDPRAQVFGTSMEDTVAMHRGEPNGMVYPSSYPPSPISKSGSTLATVVHADYPLKFSIAASLILAKRMVPTQFEDGNDKRFIDGGITHLHEIMGIGMREGLRVAWANKIQWKRPRPETYWAGFNQWALGGGGYEGFEEKFKNSQAVRACVDRFGTRCLPLVYPEGAPAHPSLPAGHSVVAAVCGTILKMWFADMPWPGDTRRDGDTIHGEIDKMVFNVSTGRSWAGVHDRLDNLTGVRIGQELGKSLYAQHINADNESGVIQSEAKFTDFYGDSVRIDLYCDPIDQPTNHEEDQA